MVKQSFMSKASKNKLPESYVDSYLITRSDKLCPMAFYINFDVIKKDVSVKKCWESKYMKSPFKRTSELNYVSACLSLKVNFVLKNFKVVQIYAVAFAFKIGSIKAPHHGVLEALLKLLKCWKFHKYPVLHLCRKTKRLKLLAVYQKPTNRLIQEIINSAPLQPNSNVLSVATTRKQGTYFLLTRNSLQLFILTNEPFMDILQFLESNQCLERQKFTKSTDLLPLPTYEVLLSEISPQILPQPISKSDNNILKVNEKSIYYTNLPSVYLFIFLEVAIIGGHFHFEKETSFLAVTTGRSSTNIIGPVHLMFSFKQPFILHFSFLKKRQNPSEKMAQEWIISTCNGILNSSIFVSTFMPAVTNSSYTPIIGIFTHKEGLRGVQECPGVLR
ncbi:hypothetical protein EGR_04004 [Echinococcus granulosus]|uniref:Uncharacterized protein n=1 Tax=Echinococcus granulosus TaxID=6210 RepID=W6UJ26_ECHGR|nr:hypothetical protein EGR_04004 [Echinococcus granulosus]EUB61156.1 hypothetical protein EGR_04004 [Echinococcus granulosus]